MMKPEELSIEAGLIRNKLIDKNDRLQIFDLGRSLLSICETYYAISNDIQPQTLNPAYQKKNKT